ncbi:hypothetical protein RFI_05592 [Reticulomyxa filosa]|uniref:Uncharacterized protein n=1 Tax=Reticulomyxa filosa TaxID=46433 RepID=X6P1U6_RETFI|nr:hypothetical protein RFI_05592 [Reticulomyxa filosa]|eukprot:ETO31527.1 hypothetical protein RFI_05592 [Reticulomyxa filosa]
MSVAYDSSINSLHRTFLEKHKNASRSIVSEDDYDIDKKKRQQVMYILFNSIRFLIFALVMTKICAHKQKHLQNYFHESSENVIGNWITPISEKQNDDCTMLANSKTLTNSSLLGLYHCCQCLNDLSSDIDSPYRYEFSVCFYNYYQGHKQKWKTCCEEMTNQTISNFHFSRLSWTTGILPFYALRIPKNYLGYAVYVLSMISLYAICTIYFGVCRKRNIVTFLVPFNIVVSIMSYYLWIRAIQFHKKFIDLPYHSEISKTYHNVSYITTDTNKKELCYVDSFSIKQNDILECIALIMLVYLVAAPCLLCSCQHIVGHRLEGRGQWKGRLNRFYTALGPLLGLTVIIDSLACTIIVLSYYNGIDRAWMITLICVLFLLSVSSWFDICCCPFARHNYQKKIDMFFFFYGFRCCKKNRHLKKSLAQYHNQTENTESDTSSVSSILTRQSFLQYN